MSNIIVWDIETVPDLKGFAAVNGHAGINEKAPIEVDSKTLLTKVQRTGKVIIYSYKIMIDKSLWIPLMEESLVQTTIKNNCTNESVRTLL